MIKKILILTGICSSVLGATINVAAPYAETNAQTAINSASTGDTVAWPSGANLTYSSSITNNKAITLQGNGTTLNAGATLTRGFFDVGNVTNSTDLLRITGFIFNNTNLNSGSHALYMLDNLAVDNVRIDNNTFHHGDIQIEIGGCKGVVDHNIFYNGRSCVYFTAGTRAQADASWTNMAAGTSQALFFEDNRFEHNTGWLGANENNSVFDTYNGGKLVIRYNYFLATNVPVSWTGPYGAILTHGSAAGGAAVAYWQADSQARRGQSVVEIYTNRFDAKRIDFLAQLRGSANIVCSNLLDTTAFNPRIYAYEEEQDVVQWSPNRTAWPAEDQVHNSFFWANTLRLNGVVNSSYFEVGASSASYIQQDRDYFLHEPQSSGGKETFTGANGASSSYPTDGVVYPTSGTMTFSSAGANAYYPYVPYTYPHPLTVTNTVYVQQLRPNSRITGNTRLRQ